MKVEREEKTVAVYEGGDEKPAEDDADKPKTRQDHYKEKYGDSYAEGLDKEKGMAFERGCTDFLCVVIFLVFISCMFAVAIFGLIKGEPGRLFAPYDFDYRFCGYDPEVKEFPNLFITNFQATYSDAYYAAYGDWDSITYRIFHAETVCVKTCPSVKNPDIECPPDQVSQDKCNDAKNQKPPTVFKGSSLMNICLPEYDQLPVEAKQNWNEIINGIKKNDLFQEIVYLGQSWKAILFSMGTSLVLAIIYIYAMSLVAEYVAWGLIFLVQVGLILGAFGGLYSYTQYTGEDKEYGQAGLVAGIISGIMAIIFCFAVYCGWRQLKISIEIINCSADFLAATKRLTLVPFLYFVFMLLFFLFWLASVISVESMGKIQAECQGPSEYRAPHCDKDPSLFSKNKMYVPLDKDISWDDRKELGKTVNIMLAFLVFGLIWFTFFLQASNNYVTMVTASTFYFSSTRKELGSGQVATGLRWAWVHNFGSVAFGSFIIALIFTIRMLVYYVCKKAEKASGDNGFIKAITCIAMCVLKCLEDIMEYINKAAYAYMSITGDSFCKSALNGLMLQLNHGASFAFANLLASLFILLGKVGLTIANCVIVYFYLTGTAPKVEGDARPPSPWGPLVLVAFTTFVLVSVFLGMFDESVIAMMTCLAADLNLHDDDNIWGPPSLHRVIDTIHGKDPEEEDKRLEAEEKAKANDIN